MDDKNKLHTLARFSIICSLCIALSGCSFYTIVSFISDVLSIYSFVESGQNDDREFSVTNHQKPRIFVVKNVEKNTNYSYSLNSSEILLPVLNQTSEIGWYLRIKPSTRMAPVVEAHDGNSTQISDPVFDLKGNMIWEIRSSSSALISLKIMDRFNNGGTFSYEIVPM